MIMTRAKALSWTLSLAALCATAFGQNANQAGPGTLNYVEGQASIEGAPLNSKSVGNTTLEAGQVLATANGRAEVLLTPGIFVRLGDNSTLQMLSPDLTHTEVRLDRGRANVEVDQIYPQNTILVDLKNGQTQLLKTGLYSFDADSSTVRVFDGQAAVYPGANLQSNIKPIEVKGDRQIVLNEESLKPQRFNKDQAEADPLYKWSGLRSDYLGQANLNLASEYAGYSNFYPGWYWAGGSSVTHGFPAAVFSGIPLATASTLPGTSTAEASSTTVVSTDIPATAITEATATALVPHRPTPNSVEAACAAATSAAAASMAEAEVAAIANH